MSVQDITPDAVVTAVQAGHDNLDKLAEHFGVMYMSHTLNTTLTKLIESWPPRLVPANPGTGEPTRWAVA